MANLIWDPDNNVWKGTFTISNDGTGNSNETYTIDLGDADGPVTVTLNGIDTTIYPGATNSINVTDCSSWSLSAAPDPVTEGNSVIASLATTGVSDGTYAFSITGVQSGDIQETGGITWDAANSKYIGNFSLSNNASSITLNILDDSSADGPETLTLSLDNGEDSVNVVINDPAAPAVCGSGINNSLTTNGSSTVSVSGSGISTTFFDNGGTFYYPNFSGTDILPYSVVFKIGSTGTLGLMSVYKPLNDPSDKVSYEFGGSCYEANLSDPVDGDGAIVLNLV